MVMSLCLGEMLKKNVLHRMEEMVELVSGDDQMEIEAT